MPSEREARERLDDAVSMFAGFRTDAARDEVDRATSLYRAAVAATVQAEADAVLLSVMEDRAEVLNAIKEPK